MTDCLLFLGVSILLVQGFPNFFYWRITLPLPTSLPHNNTICVLRSARIQLRNQESWFSAKKILPVVKGRSLSCKLLNIRTSDAQSIPHPCNYPQPPRAYFSVMPKHMSPVNAILWNNTVRQRTVYKSLYNFCLAKWLLKHGLVFKCFKSIFYT